MTLNMHSGVCFYSMSHRNGFKPARPGSRPGRVFPFKRDTPWIPERAESVRSFVYE